MSETPLRIDAVVLAAGGSSRLGTPKQSIALGGETLLARAARLAREAVNGDVHIVLGATAPHDLPTLEKQDVRPHIFADWEQGQSASLRFGLGQCEQADGVLIMLVDQYRLQLADLQSLLATWRAQPQRPAAAAYGDAIGVPVVWPRAQVDVLRLSGKLGRHVLDRATCNAVALASARWDLDTPDDLSRLREHERTRSG